MKNLTRADLVDGALPKSRLKRYHVESVATEFFNVMAEFLDRGDAIWIRGYFSLTPVTRAGRPARNPRTMEDVWIPPYKTVRGVFPARVGTRRVTVYPIRSETVKALAEPFCSEVESG